MQFARGIETWNCCVELFTAICPTDFAPHKLNVRQCDTIVHSLAPFTARRAPSHRWVHRRTFLVHTGNFGGRKNERTAVRVSQRAERFITTVVQTNYHRLLPGALHLTAACWTTRGARPVSGQRSSHAPWSPACSSQRAEALLQRYKMARPAPVLAVDLFMECHSRYCSSRVDRTLSFNTFVSTLMTF